jgi:hypothetical protein
MNKTSENKMNYSIYSHSYTISENFDTHSYQPTGNSSLLLSYEVTPLIAMSSDYSNKLASVNQNYLDLSSNIGKITNSSGTGLRDDLSNNPIYDYNTPFLMNKPKTTLDGLIYDNKLLSVQENSMYVLATITAVTLIVFAILIGRE